MRSTHPTILRRYRAAHGENMDTMRPNLVPACICSFLCALCPLCVESSRLERFAVAWPTTPAGLLSITKISTSSRSRIRGGLQLRPQNHVLQALVATPQGAHAWVAVPLSTQETSQPRHATDELAHRH